jgi:hypothetical protein
MVDGFSCSGKNPAFSFSACIDKKIPANVKLNNIGKLTGQQNNRIWSSSMTIIPKEIKAYEIVVDSVSPAEDADATEIETYDHRYHTMSTIIIQVVLQDLLEKIVELERPHLMSTWLHTEY